MSLDDVVRKAAAVMPGLLVTRQRDADGVLARLPRFVADYLVAQSGWDQAVRQVEQYFPSPDRGEALKALLIHRGSVTVLDQLVVRVDVNRGKLLASLAHFAVPTADVAPAIVDAAPGVLGAGLWGRITLVHRPSADKGQPSVAVVEFSPITTEAQLAEFVAWRAQFSADEWLDLWLASLGWHPDVLAEASPDPWRAKLLVLARLVPLVEPRYNMIELGTKNTGKTYLYRHASPRALVVSGGRTTPAELFVNVSTGRIGIVARTDCVVFDEVAGLTAEADGGAVSILKDYMESGHFSRGGYEYNADASIVLLGNIAVEGGQPASYYDHLLQVLPSALKDAAIVDRVHGFLPGWEVPKLTPDLLGVNVGLPADFVGSVLTQLRHWPVDGAVQRLVAQHPYLGVTRRDERAMEKTVRGLVKLLAPDGVVPDDVGRRILSLAAELRQRVHQQLVVMDPGEFYPKLIGFQGVEPSNAGDLTRARSWDEHDHRLNERPAIGEITALLAYVNEDGEPVGGDVQVIQAALLPGGGTLRMTGFRGSAMEQSAMAAYHYLRDHRADFRIPTETLQDYTLAVHLVQIDRQREGPSAGLAFLLAMLSALTNRAVAPALAVTGEVSLHGQIEPVGALLPKLYAAGRHGRRCVLVPAANATEVRDLPPFLHEMLEIVTVATVTDALAVAFGLHALPIPDRRWLAGE